MADGVPERQLHQDELVDSLVTLGMSRKDAEIYVRLSSAGPQKAGSLAKLMGWNRPETYRALGQLVEREFVEATLTRPIEFRAVPVARLFAQIERIHQDRLVRLEASRDSVEQAMSRLQQRASKDAGDEHGLRVIHGRELCHAAAERMIVEARHSIQLACTVAPALKAMALAGILRQAQKRADEGVKLEWIVGPSAAELAPVARAQAHRAPEGKDARLLIVDASQALCWLSNAPSHRLNEPSEAAFWTNAPPFVAAQSTFFQLLRDASFPEKNER